MRPDRRALTVTGAGGQEERLTWAELAARVDRAAAVLAAAGLGAGHRLAVRLPDRLEHVLAILAAFRLGAAVVPLHPRLTEGETAWQLADAAAQLLVSDEVPDTSAAENDIRTIAPAELLSGADPLRLGEPEPTPHDRVLTVLYTSGTTGRPKPVPATAGRHLASAGLSAWNLGVRPDDDWLCCLRLCHMGGLAILLRSLVQGTALTLVDGFEPDDIARRMIHGEVSLVSLVPTMLRRLLALPEVAADPTSLAGSGRLRAILLGGGPIDRPSLAKALEAGLPVVSTYGMTETCSQVATMPLDADVLERRIGSAGLPLPGLEVEIRDGFDRQVPAGLPGEIHLRGPVVAVPGPGGWFATGDHGRLGPDGFLWVEGRREDLVVTGGENVYPAEVESALGGHPAVVECAVYGEVDAEWGERVVAAVVLRQGVEIGEEELAGFCRERLAGFKVPRRWCFLEELPRTASGKIKRRSLPPS